MHWKQTTETTWRADGDGVILYVTKRKPRLCGLLQEPDIYWPTVNIGGRFIPLERVETLEEAQAACELEACGALIS